MMFVKLGCISNEDYLAVWAIIYEQRHVHRGYPTHWLSSRMATHDHVVQAMKKHHCEHCAETAMAAFGAACLLVSQLVPEVHVIAYGALLVWVFMEAVDAAAKMLSTYDDLN